MMEYTGKYYSIYSEELGQEVNVLEYINKEKMVYSYWEKCSHCGKPIKHKMYVVQSAEDDVEMLYLGADCVKKFH